MANHKSAIKRIRQSETRRLRNRYYSKTMRNAVRNIRKMTDAKEAAEAMPRVTAMLDKLAGKNVISKNKAAIRYGPFVYRLGRKIFILERAVRFCYGLPQQSVNVRV